MPTDYTDDLRLAHVLADDADSITTARFKALDLHVMSKPDLTPVTDADQAVEDGIRRTLSRVRSRDAVVGEESGTTGHSQRRWVVDPIDGTKNFVRGVPVWATLISLVVDDEVVVGVVSAPAAPAALVGLDAARGVDRPVPAQGRALHGVRRRRLDDASLSYSSLARLGGARPAATTSSRLRDAAGAPGPTATSGRTCSSPRARSTSRPSRSWSSTTWRRST